MRRLGWYADSWPELAMNLGTWGMVLALGMAIGQTLDGEAIGIVFIIAAVIGSGGQLVWALSDPKEVNE